MDHEFIFHSYEEPIDPWDQYPFVLDSVKN